MSWLLAELRSVPTNPDTLRPAWSPPGGPLHVVDSDRFQIRAGGLAATCLRGTSIVEGEECGWIVLGMGFRHVDSSARLLAESEWSAILSSPRPDLTSLDGHFVIVRWSDTELECFSDQLGMRTLYIAERPGGGCVIATRQDWLAQRTGRRSVSLAALGGHWLLANPMASDALVEGVRRLGAGGYFRYRDDRMTLEERPWAPSSNEDREPVGILQHFLHPEGLGGRTLSLGLSGGLDSRVLLALLVAGGGPIATHVFGDESDPDVVVSRRIAKGEGLEQRHLDDTLPPQHECIAMLRDYVGWSAAIEPASAITKLRYYPRLEADGIAVVDGGLGEIARRQYLKRLLMGGRRALVEKDAAAVYEYVRHHRADIFNTDALAAMKAGAIDQLSRMLDAMPEVASIGAENFVDLMAVRTRFPYFAGLEQARTDATSLCYMPFAQPSFISAIFPRPEERRGGRLLRRIVRESAPQLRKYPLVKSGVPIPYAVPNLGAIAWSRVQKKLARAVRPSAEASLLDHMAEFVRDTASSQSVRMFEGYDHANVTSLVDRFYAGERGLALAVNWWLAFEVWRQGVSSNAGE
jgi:hypothetical protein